MEILRVDCDYCAVRGLGCGDCVISVLLGVPEDTPSSIELMDEERAAREALAESGLASPLRVIGTAPSPAQEDKSESQPWLDGRFAE